MRILAFDQGDLDHTPVCQVMGWDPDAVAPPSGDVYEREAGLRVLNGWLTAVLIGVTAAVLLMGAQTIAHTHTLFGVAF